MSFTSKQDFLHRARTFMADPHADLSDAPSPHLPKTPGDGSGIPIKELRPASVLFGLVEREDDFSVILTQRPESMRAHAGQVALPGGKRDPDDHSAAAVALREAEEEIGARRADVDLIGQLAPMQTNTGFSVSLFVGLLPQTFVPTPCPREVADVFETPLSFLMNAENHELHEVEWGGTMRQYYAMPHNGRYIWGVTAALIKKLYNMLYMSEVSD